MEKLELGEEAAFVRGTISIKKYFINCWFLNTELQYFMGSLGSLWLHGIFFQLAIQI